MIVKYCAQLHQVKPSILINTAKIFVPMTMYVSYKRNYAKFLNPAEEIHFLLLQLLSVHLIFYMKKVNSDYCLTIQGVVIDTIVRPQIQYFFCNLVINSQVSKKKYCLFYLCTHSTHRETERGLCVL